MRFEQVHPLVIHIPILLLFIGTIIRFIALCLRKRSSLSFLLPTSWVILGLGVITAWIAIIAVAAWIEILYGNLPQDIAAPALDNFRALAEYRHHAHYAANGFTIALCIDIARRYHVERKGGKKWFTKRGLAGLLWVFYLFSLTHLIIAESYGVSLISEEAEVQKIP